MKLINKISLWFLGITLLLTPLCVVISYHGIRDKIDHAQIARMALMNESVSNLIRDGKLTADYTNGKSIQIEKTNGPMPAQTTQAFNGSNGEKNIDKDGYIITVTSYYNINGTVYKISSYNYTTNTQQIFLGMLKGVFSKILLIGIAVILIARYFSKKMFLPFKESIRALNNFSVKDKKELILPDTNIKEFRQLNRFLKKMTEKVIKDYNKVKEFSENASHELQTPLAVVRTKLELLTETNIDEHQAGLIGDMQNAIEKLSSINRSLVLLSKLENNEFEQEEIKFCKVTKNVLSMYDDWIALREIKVSTRLDSNIYIHLHHSLAEILLANLISNAIRHNFAGGEINIELSRSMLSVSNTGDPINLEPKELFLRFKKGNQSGDGIGLGLAIVKQICDEADFKVIYNYASNKHTFTIFFDKSKILHKHVQELPVEEYSI